MFISNSLPDKVRDNTIIKGNERVLKARLSDAKFFWNSDKANNLEDWNEKLKNVPKKPKNVVYFPVKYFENISNKKIKEKLLNDNIKIAKKYIMAPVAK